MRKLSKLLVVLMISLPLHSDAQLSEQQINFNDLTPADVVSILRNYGYTESYVHKGGVIDCIVAPERTIQITVNNPRYLQLHVTISNSPVTLEIVNKWNSNYLFTKATLTDGYLKLRLDVLSDDLDDHKLMKQVELFKSSISAFARFLSLELNLEQ